MVRNTAHLWLQRKRLLIAQPFVQAVVASAVPIVLSDPSEPDCPIIFANAAFLNLTGYAEDEVLGRNCRFLQGADTDRETVAQIRQALADHQPIHAEILNYRRDGSAFWNELHIAPIFDEEGGLLLFVGSQIDVDARKRAEEALQTNNAMLESLVAKRTAALEKAVEHAQVLSREVTHRVRNSLQLVITMLRLQQTNLESPSAKAALDDALQRIGAIANIQNQLDRLDGSGNVDVTLILGETCAELSRATGTDVRCDCVEGTVPGKAALPIALCVTELVLNAQKHAYGGRTGPVDVSLTKADDGSGDLVLTVRDHGPGLPEGFDPMHSRGLGMMVLRSQANEIGATLSFETAASGARFALRLPANRAGTASGLTAGSETS